MVTIRVVGSLLTLEVLGLDRLWSLRSRLEIPLEHIRGVEAAPDIAKRWCNGLKLSGAHIPGLLMAGTFYQDGKLVFWDVHDPHQAIALDLTHERYQRLVIEVADPAEAVRVIREAMAASA